MSKAHDLQLQLELLIGLCGHSKISRSARQPWVWRRTDQHRTLHWLHVGH